MKKLFRLIIFLLVISAFGICAVARLFPLEYKEIIVYYSEEYDVSPTLVAAIIKAESNWQTDAVSSAGAKGLMQVMPSTAEWLNEKYKLNLDEENLFDPKTNIEFGCCYLSFLIQKFEVLKTACAAYNAGQGNVDEWLNKYSDDGKNLNYIPFKETEKYVKRVMTRYEIYKDLYN